MLIQTNAVWVDIYIYSSNVSTVFQVKHSPEGLKAHLPPALA